MDDIFLKKLCTNKKTILIFTLIFLERKCNKHIAKAIRFH